MRAKPSTPARRTKNLKNLSLLSLCAGVALATTPASAREIDRIEIAQLVDPSVSITSQTSCTNDKKIAAGQIETLRLCTDWRQELSYTITRRFLVADAPAKLSKDQRKLVSACLGRAAARAQTEAGAAGVLLPDAQIGFDRCAVGSQIADAENITLSFVDKSEQRRLR